MSSEAATCDVLVIGSGAGGFAAAVSAKAHGLEVILTEKHEHFGGTSAWSGGAVWIPGNSFAKAAGIKETVDQARIYLRHESGNYFDAARVEAYLTYGSDMVDFFHQKTAVKWLPDFPFADYHPDVEGGVDGGRSLWAEPYDGKKLGKWFSKLRPPMSQYTLWGMAIGSGMDYRHFLRMKKSPKSALHVLKRISHHFFDVALHGRGTTLFNGNALIARLAKSALDLGIPIWLKAPATSLIVEDGRVVGAVINREGKSVNVRARRGVVLACGGFPHDTERVRKTFHPVQSYTGAPKENTGDGIRMAESVGAALKTDYMSTSYSAPLSKIRRKDGTIDAFPHFADRGKPGIIAVADDGRRFTNESNSYHDFVQDMIKNGLDGETKSAFFVCDHPTIRSYGLGYAKPWPLPLAPHLKSGYIVRGKTIEELAERAGIDPVGLRATVDSFNAHARYGFDPDFHRGSNAYDRFQGDLTHTPNPSLHPIEKGPFYALKVYPGYLGTLIGLSTNEHAEVLRDDGSVVPGLYATGNDMASVFGGSCPGGGITVGPGMVFGYLIGHRLGNAGA